MQERSRPKHVNERVETATVESGACRCRMPERGEPVAVVTTMTSMADHATDPPLLVRGPAVLCHPRQGSLTMGRTTTIVHSWLATSWTIISPRTTWTPDDPGGVRTSFSRLMKHHETYGGGERAPAHMCLACVALGLLKICDERGEIFDTCEDPSNPTSDAMVHKDRDARVACTCNSRLSYLQICGARRTQEERAARPERVQKEDQFERVTNEVSSISLPIYGETTYSALSYQ